MKQPAKKILSVLLIIAMLISTGMMTTISSATTVSIPDDAVMFNGHYYKVYSIAKTWTEAKIYCEDLGGHLVTITSQEENKFVSSLLKNGGALIGFSDEENEGIWKWVNNEKVVYTNWWNGEPNNQGNEDYALIDSNGGWNDGHLEREHWYFICEWESEATLPEIEKTEYHIAERTFYENIDDYTAKCSSSSYNVELANMTAALSKAVYSRSEITNAYKSLGFSNIDNGIFDYDGSFNPNSCGYAIDFKKSEYNDDTICLIAVRGSSNTSDWIGNVNIDVSFEGKHLGFYKPAQRIYGQMKSIIKDRNITGNIKYVITGHSRGAAVANLLAVELMEKGVSSADIYNYNFACPDVACKFSFAAYSNIFNICNRVDIVPFVPGSICSALTLPGTSWGKYGNTYWFTKNLWDGSRSILDNIKANHDMALYLEVTDQQKLPSAWEFTESDKDFDVQQKMIGYVTKILCPVDVVVKDIEGNKIASVINGEVNYYGSNFGDVIIFTDGDKKIIYINGDKNFNVELVGTDDGRMTYSLEKYNLMTEEVLESKTFENVKLEEGKMMNSPVFQAATTNDVELFVVNEQKKITHTVNTDGSEEIYTKDCSHLCHNDNAFMQFIWKIINFLSKIFGANEFCDCGMKHW